MGSSDKYILAGIVIAGIAGLMWYGERQVKNASESFAKALTLPNINVAMPSITMPNVSVTMPDINMSGPDINGIAALLGQSHQYQDWNAGFEELKKLLGQNQGAPIGGTYPATKTTQVPVNYDVINQYNGGGLLPDITSKLSGVIDMKKDTNKSTSAGGNGIFVENGDKDYYIPDNSLYGGSSGMPAPVQEQPKQETIAPLFGKFEDIHLQIEAQAKADAEAKLREFEKKNNVILPRGR